MVKNLCCEEPGQPCARRHGVMLTVPLQEEASSFRTAKHGSYSSTGGNGETDYSATRTIYIHLVT